MKFNFNLRGRRSIRLLGHDYSAPGDYFITICIMNMECVLGKIREGKMELSKTGEIIRKEWLNTELVRPIIRLGPFSIMPNHLHGIITIHSRRGDPAGRPDGDQATSWASQRDAPTLESETIGAILGQFKSLSTKKIHAIDLIGFHWQRNYYEHIIRNKAELEQVKNYILENPLKWSEDPDNPINL